MEQLPVGKRVFVKRVGRKEFELPERHSAELVEFGSRRSVQLETPDSSTNYALLRIDEGSDRVAIHLGELFTDAAPAGWGSAPEATGYPFPDEPAETDI